MSIFKDFCIIFVLFSKMKIQISVWIGGEKGSTKTFDAAFYYTIQTQLYWLLNLKLFICSLMCPGIRWNAFCLDIVKVLNKFTVWFYWFSPKCQSSVFNPIHDSLAVYRWQTFITELETMENVLQLVHKVAVSVLCAACERWLYWVYESHWYGMKIICIDPFQIPIIYSPL